MRPQALVVGIAVAFAVAVVSAAPQACTLSFSPAEVTLHDVQAAVRAHLKGPALQTPGEVTNVSLFPQ